MPDSANKTEKLRGTPSCQHTVHTAHQKQYETRIEQRLIILRQPLHGSPVLSTIIHFLRFRRHNLHLQFQST